MKISPKSRHELSEIAFSTRLSIPHSSEAKFSKIQFPNFIHFPAHTAEATCTIQWLLRVWGRVPRCRVQNNKNVNEIYIPTDDEVSTETGEK